MSRGILTGGEVKLLHKFVHQRFGQPYEASRLAEFVNTINIHIRPLHLEIKKIVNEVTEVHCYALANNAESDITRLSSDYSVNELEFFKKLVEAVVESEGGCISSTEALNLTEDLERKMTKKDAQDLLEKLEKSKWVFQDKGQIYLSPRSILELDKYIQDQFPAMATKCNLCNRLCITGKNCPRCDVKLHNHCAARYFNGQSDNICPGKECSVEWTDLPAPKSSQAPRSGGDDEPGQSQRKSQRKRRGEDN